MSMHGIIVLQKGAHKLEYLTLIDNKQHTKGNSVIIYSYGDGTDVHVSNCYLSGNEKVVFRAADNCKIVVVDCVVDVWNVYNVFSSSNIKKSGEMPLTVVIDPVRLEDRKEQDGRNLNLKIICVFSISSYSV